MSGDSDSPAQCRAVASLPCQIRPVSDLDPISELRGVLAVQRDAFTRVARELGLREPERLPPLQESLTGLLRCRESGTTIYVALENRRVIGSVRATQAPDGFIDVGRLVVAGHRLRRGVATALMDTLEDAHGDSATFRLFTGADATGALAFYRERGYLAQHTDPSGPVELVWLCKYPESHA